MTTSPRILIDATAIPADRGGVGRYLAHLIPALAELDTRLEIACQPRDAGLLAAAAPDAGVHPAAATGRSRLLRLGWEQVALPRLARRVGADLIFSPHYTMPLMAGVPVVVTLHDATFFSHPELHGPVKRAFFKYWTRLSLRRAAACVVPSRATRTELVRWARPRRDRMTVAYHGVDTEVFHVPSAEEVDAARARIGADDWIAFLGTLEPRKNVTSLVRAFGELDPRLRLVLAGATGWDAEVDGAIAESPARDRILRLGFVDDRDLAAVLGGARVFVYPSLGEGFGLPVLEAMACGSVVVTTPFLALPEVGGQVAIYTQPDAPAIASAVRAAMAEPGRRRRSRGVERAAGFSWEASARTHLSVFASAAEAEA